MSGHPLKWTLQLLLEESTKTRGDSATHPSRENDNGVSKDFPLPEGWKQRMSLLLITPRISILSPRRLFKIRVLKSSTCYCVPKCDNLFWFFFHLLSKQLTHHYPFSTVSFPAFNALLHLFAFYSKKGKQWSNAANALAMQLARIFCAFFFSSVSCGWVYEKERP